MTTDTSRSLATIPMVTKSQITADTTTTDTRQPMAMIPMVTKCQRMADTTITDTRQPMAMISMVTKSQLKNWPFKSKRKLENSLVELTSMERVKLLENS